MVPRRINGSLHLPLQLLRIRQPPSNVRRPHLDFLPVGSIEITSGSFSCPRYFNFHGTLNPPSLWVMLQAFPQLHPDRSPHYNSSQRASWPRSMISGIKQQYRKFQIQFHTVSKFRLMRPNRLRQCRCENCSQGSSDFPFCEVVPVLMRRIECDTCDCVPRSADITWRTNVWSDSTLVLQ